MNRDHFSIAYTYVHTQKSANRTIKWISFRFEIEPVSSNSIFTWNKHSLLDRTHLWRNVTRRSNTFNSYIEFNLIYWNALSMQLAPKLSSHWINKHDCTRAHLQKFKLIVIYTNEWMNDNKMPSTRTQFFKEKNNWNRIENNNRKKSIYLVLMEEEGKWRAHGEQRILFTDSKQHTHTHEFNYRTQINN